MNTGLYRPPAPVPLPTLPGLLRAILRGERDLLNLLPIETYRMMVGPLGRSRRGILMVNDPAEVTEILTDPGGLFPKNDLMVGALSPLVGDSIFVSSGATWRRQRRMIEPGFTHMRVNRAFEAMAEAVDSCEDRLDKAAADGTPLSLDEIMVELTADIICRTIFSKRLDHDVARDVFDSFTAFQQAVADVRIARLLLGKPFAQARQPPAVTASARRIRDHLGALLDPRLVDKAEPIDDIAGALVAAIDDQTGARFTRSELIDQLAVFFIAGHETTASTLTWAFFILSQVPGAAARIRAESADMADGGALGFDQVKRLSFTRAVVREVLRLYPPITFIPRVALGPAIIAGHRVKRGAMLMISPWTIHRHQRLWPDPDRFDPDRFMPERERETRPGAYLPFGTGPRICVGAAFAMTEAVLILARLSRRYRIEPLSPETVRPCVRLTTRPKREIMVRFRRL